MTDNVTSKEKQKENQQSKIRGLILVKNKQSLLRPFWVNQLKLSKRKKTQIHPLQRAYEKKDYMSPRTHTQKKKKKKKRKKEKEKKRKTNQTNKPNKQTKKKKKKKKKNAEALRIQKTPWRIVRWLP